MTTQQIQIRKRLLSAARVVDTGDAAGLAASLADGQVLMKVDAFSYTANNITYAAFGEAMHYWDFFPTAAAPGDTEAERASWGCVPVWGFADVLHSRHAGLAPGERIYGYWPMASHAVLQPDRINASGFVDGAAHRASLHAVYNQYQRCAADPYYTVDTEGLQALMRPLFMTAWLIDDFLAGNAFFGAAAMPAAMPTDALRGYLLLSSASSKTAYATAAHLRQRSGVQVIGLTSQRNLQFCNSLGVYDRVVCYDDLPSLGRDRPAVYVDFAGSAALRKAVHAQFEALAYSCAIGGTHVADLSGGRGLPGPKPVLFFAPAQVKKRVAEWGGAAFQGKLVTAWRRFRDHTVQGLGAEPSAVLNGGAGLQAMAPPAVPALSNRSTPSTPSAAQPWLQVQWRRGTPAVLAAHAEVLAGQGDPRTGLMLSLHV